MTQQHSLQSLRRQLRQLGRVRRGRRWLCGFSTLIALLVWGLAAVFLIDVAFQLDVLQRITVLLLVAAATGWAMFRFVLPFFHRPETEIELALLVERLHGIDTDLVAAIEFTRPEATRWGSGALRDQVISAVTQRGPQLDMRRAVDEREPRRRLRMLLLTLAAAAILLVMLPQHVPVFLRRLALADDHYPSRTVIESIVINGQLVLQPQDALSPRPARCPERGPVDFQVSCTRDAPAGGELLISDSSGGAQHRIPLTRRDAAQVAGRSHETVFVAQLPALFDSLRYQVYLGDAWTNPGLIELVPLPQIVIQTDVVPPAYTGTHTKPVPIEGTGRLIVLEGSRIELTVRSANEKRLQAVSIELQTPSRNAHAELGRIDRAGTVWRLAKTAFPPLHSVHETIRFTIHATDQDGLKPTHPLQGDIRVQRDLPPDAIAVTIHDVVLPGARPHIALHVQDDFAIGRVRLRVQIERRSEPGHEGDDRAETSSPAEPVNQPEPPEVHWLDVTDVSFPLEKSQLPYRSRYALDLMPWKLHKGDRIKVTLEATDFRGPTAGALGKSKPLYLEVSDQAGVLAAILKADHQTEQDLDEMIQRQLGLGE